MSEVPFADLIPSHFSADQKQDAYLALLEDKPATKEEALTLLRRIHHRNQREWRYREYQLIPDVAERVESDTSTFSFLYPALASLPNEDGDLLSAHYVEGLTYAEMEQRFGIPHSTLYRRMTAAVADLKNKLRESPE